MDYAIYGDRTLTALRMTLTVLVRTGNMGLGDTKVLFVQHLPAISLALESCTLVEIDRQAVSVVA